MTVVEECPGLISNLPETIDNDLVQQTFETAHEYLLSRFSYIKAKEMASPGLTKSQWALSYWSKMTRRSMVEKYGTAEEKARLPQKTTGQANRDATRKKSRVGGLLANRKASKIRKCHRREKLPANTTVNSQPNN